MFGDSVRYCRLHVFTVKGEDLMLKAFSAGLNAAGVVTLRTLVSTGRRDYELDFEDAQFARQAAKAMGREYSERLIVRYVGSESRLEELEARMEELEVVPLAIAARDGFREFEISAGDKLQMNYLARTLMFRNLDVFFDEGCGQ
jgi:hypothetical protein